MNRTSVLLGLLILILVPLILGLIFTGQHIEERVPILEEEFEEVIPVTKNELYEYGSSTMKVGEQVQFRDLTLQVLDILQESRCPTGVVCIQAGTVQVDIMISSRSGTRTSTLALGELVTTEAETITFEDASPYPIAGENIPTSAYTLTFNVEKRVDSLTAPQESPVYNIPETPDLGACYVGGCSSQLCTDSPDMASTCEYREEYACYQDAVCERQTSGACGWTETSALLACLAGVR